MRKSIFECPMCGANSCTTEKTEKEGATTGIRCQGMNIPPGKPGYKPPCGWSGYAKWIFGRDIGYFVCVIEPVDKPKE